METYCKVAPNDGGKKRGYKASGSERWTLLQAPSGRVTLGWVPRLMGGGGSRGSRAGRELAGSFYGVEAGHRLVSILGHGVGEAPDGKFPIGKFLGGNFSFLVVTWRPQWRAPSWRGLAGWSAILEPPFPSGIRHLGAPVSQPAHHILLEVFSDSPICDFSIFSQLGEF